MLLSGLRVCFQTPPTHAGIRMQARGLLGEAGRAGGVGAGCAGGGVPAGRGGKAFGSRAARALTQGPAGATAGAEVWEALHAARAAGSPGGDNRRRNAASYGASELTCPCPGHTEGLRAQGLVTLGTRRSDSEGGVRLLSHLPQKAASSQDSTPPSDGNAACVCETDRQTHRESKREEGGQVRIGGEPCNPFPH